MQDLIDLGKRFLLAVLGLLWMFFGIITFFRSDVAIEMSRGSGEALLIVLVCSVLWMIPIYIIYRINNKMI